MTHDTAVETRDLDIFDDLQNSVDALDTFVRLIDTAAHYEPTMFASCNGLADLCDPHLTSLTTNIDTLRFEMARAKRRTADAAETQAANVRIEAAKLHFSEVMRGVTGQKSSEGQAPDIGQIARETNLEEESVRRVVERLQADPSAAMPTDTTGIAVSN